MPEHFLYAFEMLGYARNGPIKVGISRNVVNRRKQLLYSYGGRVPQVLGVWRFESSYAAYRVEQRVIEKFPKVEGRELLDASASDVIACIQNEIGGRDAMV